jgi:hypothetical protein
MTYFVATVFAVMVVGIRLWYFDKHQDKSTTKPRCIGPEGQGLVSGHYHYSNVDKKSNTVTLALITREPTRHSRMELAPGVTYKIPEHIQGHEGFFAKRMGFMNFHATDNSSTCRFHTFY